MRAHESRAWREVPDVAVGNERRAFARVYRGLVWRFDEHLGGFATSGATLSDFSAPLPGVMALCEGARWPCDVVSDISRIRVTVGDAAPMAVTHSHFGEMVRAAGKVVRRQAGHIARDWTAPYWTGMRDAAGAPWVTEVFFEMPLLWAWLGTEQAIVDEIDALVASVFATADPVAAVLEPLNEALRTEPRLGLSEAARNIGTSPRSLQRILAGSGLTFGDIRNRIRLERAKALLADDVLKIQTISTIVGFASTSHFTTWFRTQQGSSPSAFRRIGAHRG